MHRCRREAPPRKSSFVRRTMGVSGAVQSAVLVDEVSLGTLLGVEAAVRAVPPRREVPEETSTCAATGSRR
jgi:hypothetical protein